MAHTTNQVIDAQGRVPVVYRCSQCGHCVVFNYVISEKVEYKSSNDGQTHPSAERHINSKIEEKLTKFLQNADKGDYQALDLKHKCDKCGKVEDWSRYNPSALTKWQSALFILGILSLLVCMAGWLPWAIFLFILSVFIPLFIINLIINSAVDKHVKKMDRKNLPMAARDLETLKQKYEEAFPGEKLDIVK